MRPPRNVARRKLRSTGPTSVSRVESRWVAASFASASPSRTRSPQGSLRVTQARHEPPQRSQVLLDPVPVSVRLTSSNVRGYEFGGRLRLRDEVRTWGGVIRIGVLMLRAKWPERAADQDSAADHGAQPGRRGFGQPREDAPVRSLGIGVEQQTSQLPASGACRISKAGDETDDCYPHERNQDPGGDLGGRAGVQVLEAIDVHNDETQGPPEEQRALPESRHHRGHEHPCEDAHCTQDGSSATREAWAARRTRRRIPRAVPRD